ncbi:MAG TPA: acyl-CoA dehydrogenase family protein [Solirubrobacteraceae bacterium]|jgi:acyl-CoA dehydrogenase|nr:acyl-CoA dehydrogenase family protein [Solirubrobacteraceae bacterium]
MDLAAKAGSTAAAARRPIPPFTAEHEEFRQSVRRFVRDKLAPHANEWEAARWFPNDVFGWLAGQGYIGLKFPEQYGGDGDVVADAVFCEELAWCGSGGLAAGIGAHGGIALPPIWKFGTEEQKQRYLVPGIRGEKIAALAITEPDAGSDVASIRTLAKKVDGGYLVNGAKMFITGGCRADVIVTAVKTTDEGGHHGISFLIIERGPGVESTALSKMGWHASDTAQITFDDLFVPAENLLGEENAGFYLIMANFQWERLLMALGAVGGMQVAFEKTLKYALERQAFGRAIGHHQVIRHKLAEIAVTIEGGRDVTYSALRRYVAGEDAVREVTVAKLATQRAAFDVMDTCLQIHGGNGYMVEYDIERAARDARLGPIGGGTDEIMKEILGRSLGL